MLFRVFFVLQLLFFSVLVSAAEPNTSGWVKGPSRYWHLTWESAQETAKKNGKKIYILVTSTDGNRYCTKLREEVLIHSRFRKYAQKNLELVYLDLMPKRKMPDRQKAYNLSLSKRLGEGGLPRAFILDNEGNITGRIFGYRPLKKYVDELKDPTPVSRKLAKEEPAENKNKRSASRAVPIENAAVSEGWHTSFEIAFEKAKKANKKVLILRTGSDWDQSCKKMEQEVLSSTEFKAFAIQNLELVMLDVPKYRELSPKHRIYNNKIARQYKLGKGIPSVVIVDKNKQVIGRIRGYRNFKRFMSQLEEAVKGGER